MSETPAGPLERAARVVERALRLARGERAAYVTRHCAGDAALELLAHDLLRVHDAKELSLAGAARPVSAARGDAPDLDEGAGSRIGPYKLLQQIGEGGFGVVFMAEQERPVRRRVALKVIKLGMDTRQVVARFEQERQALALMDHPNIAKVLDAGATESGRPYFVMELVRGVSITEYCDVNHLGPRERLELFVPVCLAVQHAHHKGVIHRDLKPSNVLVTLHDGKPVPKIIDFGIAKATDRPLTDKTLFTELRAMIGTPAYMSPEQAELSGLDVDTRSDVYSLGVMLYELLTGTTPFSESELRAAGYAEMQRLIREVDPPRPSTRVSTLGEALASVAARRHMEPRRLGAALRGELDWIVMKALEKDRGRRYETAAGFAEDVRRHLAGEPVLAAPPGLVYRARKLARQHRGLVAAAAAVGAALVAALSLLVTRIRDAERRAGEHREATRELGQRQVDLEEARDSHAAAARRVRRETYAADVVAARRALELEEYARARTLLGACPEPERGLEWGYLNARAEALRFVVDGGDPRFAPDGARLLTSEGSGIAVWDLGGAEVWRRKDDSHELGNAHWSPDGQRVIAATEAGIVLLDAATGRQEHLLTPDFNRGCGASCAVSTDGSRAAWWRNCWSETEDYATTVLFDLGTRSRLSAVSGRPPDWGSGAFDPEGRRIVTVLDHLTAAVWDVESGARLCTLVGHTNTVASACFSPDGRWVLTASTDWTVRLWNAEDGKPLKILPVGSRCWMARFDADGTRMFVAAGGLQAFDVRSGARVFANTRVDWIGPRDALHDLLITFDSIEGAYRLFDARTGGERSSRAIDIEPYAAALSVDSERIALEDASNRSEVRLTTCATVRRERKETYSTSGSGSVDFLDGGHRALVVSPNLSTRFWDLDARESRRVWVDESIWIREVGPEGCYFVAEGWAAGTGGAEAREVWLYEGQECTALLSLGSGHEAPGTVAFSSDGRWIATLHENRWVRVRRLDDPAHAIELRQNEDREEAGSDTGVDATAKVQRDLESLWFAPAGRCIVAQNGAGIGIVWNRDTGEEVARSELPRGLFADSDPWSDDELAFVRFDPTGEHFVVSASNGYFAPRDRDGTWPPAKAGPLPRVNSVELNAGATHLVTREIDGLPRLFDTATGEPALRVNACSESSQFHDVAFDGSSRYAATSLAERIELFDLRRAGELGYVPTKLSTGRPLSFLGFDASSMHAATCDGEGRIQVWRFDAAPEPAALFEWEQSATPRSAPTRVCFARRALVAFWGRRGFVLRFDAPEASELRPSEELAASAEFLGETGLAYHLSAHALDELRPPLLADPSALEIDEEANQLVVRHAGRHVVGAYDLELGEALLAAPELGPDEGEVVSIEYTPDLRHAVVQSSKGGAWLFDVKSAQRVLELWPPGEVSAIGAFAPDADRFVTADGRGASAVVCEASSLEYERGLSGHDAGVVAAAIAAHGALAVTGSLDGSAIVWDLADGGIARRMAVGDSPVVAVAIDAAGERVAAATRSGGLFIGTAHGDEEPRELAGGDAPLRAIDFDPTGELVCARGARSVNLVSVATGSTSELEVGAKGELSLARFDREGLWLGVGGEQGPLLLFALDGAGSTREYDAPLPTTCVAFGPDGRTLAAGSGGGVLALFDVESGRRLVSIDLQDGRPVIGAAFTSDGKRLFAGSENGRVRLFDPQRADEELLRFQAEAPLRELWLSSDGLHVTTLSKSGELHAWDLSPDPAAQD